MWYQMAKRDQRSRLIDNIGRQIRRLNEREKNGNLNNMQLRGLNRQRENLKAFREEVKKIGKNDTVALAKAQSDYKKNGNFSSSQREIDQNTKRLVASGILPPEELDPRPPERQQSDDYQEPEGGGTGGTGTPEPEESGDEGMGGMTIMDQFGDLFSDLAQIEGMYIGAYAKAEVKDQVAKIIDKANELLTSWRAVWKPRARTATETKRCVMPLAVCTDTQTRLTAGNSPGHCRIWEDPRLTCMLGSKQIVIFSIRLNHIREPCPGTSVLSGTMPGSSETGIIKTKRA